MNQHNAERDAIIRETANWKNNCHPRKEKSYQYYFVINKTVNFSQIN